MSTGAVARALPLRVPYPNAQLAFGTAALMTLAIGATWLGPGYVFGADFPGPRHFPFPSTATSFAPVYVALAAMASILPSEIVGKLLIFGTLLTASLASFVAAPRKELVPRLAASLIYTFNPFVYDRLAYGQIGVLGGYAILPLVLVAIRRLLDGPSAKRMALLVLTLVAIAAVDIHFLIISAELIFCTVVVHVALRVRRLSDVRTLAVYLGSAIVGVALLSSYWLVPFLEGHSVESQSLSAIGGGDLYAFRTVPDPALGLVANILGLYGFWAEGTHRYVSLKEFAIGWPIVLCGLIAVCVVGVITVLRSRPGDGIVSDRALVGGLLLAAALAALLAIGLSAPLMARLVVAIDKTVPVYRGLRDAGKWIAVLALLYSQLAALGASALLNLLGTNRRVGRSRELVVPLMSALILALPVYYGNGLLYGLHAQVQPSAYPTGWYAADRLISHDRNGGRAVFLPWHGYMALSFIRNTDRVVSCPAPSFFSIPTVASQDLEIPGIAPPASADQVAISQLVKQGAKADWATTLNQYGIEYVLLAREADWNSYAYLASQPGLTLLHDYGSIVVFRNGTWHGGSP